VTPQFARIVLAILAIRAIFLSPVQGSEIGSLSRLNDSSFKRLEAVRPFRLRFTPPSQPSAALMRLDCIDGGEGDDDERNQAAQSSVQAWPLGASIPSTFPARSPIGNVARGFVRLRC
jgi:hypothetical protein